MRLLYVYCKWYKLNSSAVTNGDYFAIKEGSERMRKESDDTNVIYRLERSQMLKNSYSKLFIYKF